MLLHFIIWCLNKTINNEQTWGEIVYRLGHLYIWILKTTYILGFLFIRLVGRRRGDNQFPGSTLSWKRTQKIMEVKNSRDRNRPRVGQRERERVNKKKNNIPMVSEKIGKNWQNETGSGGGIYKIVIELKTS